MTICFVYSEIDRVYVTHETHSEAQSHYYAACSKIVSGFWQSLF